jgi:hypothetical protein
MKRVILKTGETVSLPDEAFPIEVLECGCCGHYHLLPLRGVLSEDYRDDCRFDANRYDWQELDRLFGENGWYEKSVEEQLEEEAEV